MRSAIKPAHAQQLAESVGWKSTFVQVAVIKPDPANTDALVYRLRTSLSPGLVRVHGGMVEIAHPESDQLIGTITDRDIVVRALATGAASSASVVEFITRDAQTVLDTDDLKVVLDLMGARQIRRAPVVDKHGRVVGVVSLAFWALMVVDMNQSLRSRCGTS